MLQSECLFVLMTLGCYPKNTSDASKQGRQYEDTPIASLVYQKIEDQSHNTRLPMQHALSYPEYLNKRLMRGNYIDIGDLEAFSCQAEVEALISQPK